MGFFGWIGLKSYIFRRLQPRASRINGGSSRVRQWRSGVDFRGCFQCFFCGEPYFGLGGGGFLRLDNVRTRHLVVR